jgi:hypothetical protein
VGLDEKVQERAGGACAEFRQLGRDDHIYLAWSCRTDVAGIVGTIVVAIAVHLGIGWFVCHDQIPHSRWLREPVFGFACACLSVLLRAIAFVCG